MISQIRGIILEKQPPQLVIDVQGIGYEIDAPMGTFYQLPDVGQEVVLYTHFVVREDAHLLYGFYVKKERALFRTLLKVNGVGPRLGLTILSSLDPDAFVHAVMKNDMPSLVRIPGVGKKTAERLIIEIRDKLADWELPTGSALALDKSNDTRSNILQDAIAALVALGFKRDNAIKAVAKIDNGSLASEDIIRRCLQEMV